jgi:hypothetical protein
MTLSARHGSHGPSELVRLQAEIERLRAENEELRRWKAMDKPLTAAMAVVQSDVEKLRAAKAELVAVLRVALNEWQSGRHFPEERVLAAIAKAEKKT